MTDTTEHCVMGVDYEDEPTGFTTVHNTSCTDLDGGGQCYHCECCCTCLGCEYGPQNGMLLTEEQRAPIAAVDLGTDGKA